MKCSAFGWIARLGRDPCALLIVVLAGLGTAHILFRTASYGAAVDADSVLHLSTAMNVLAGEGWREFTGLKVVGWLPLFPLLLAALGGLGIDPLEAGRLVNAAAFGLILLAAGLYLRSHLWSRGLALAASVALAASLPLSEFASSFLTEPLFVLFTLLALMQLAAGLNRKTAWPPLGWAAVFTVLAVLTRYAGVVLVGTGVLLLLLAARRKQALVFGVCSSAPLLAVLAHNWTVYRSGGNYDPFFENDLVVYGRLTEEGEGRGSGQSLADGLSQIVEVFYAWVVPPNAPDEFAYLLWLAVGLIGLVSAVVVLRATRMRSDNSRHEPEAAPPFCGLGLALPFGVFALIYLVFMLVAVPFTVGYGIGSRYLLPMYVPLLLVAVFLLDRFLVIEAEGWLAAARYGLASLVLLGALAHIGYSADRNLTITDKARVLGFKDWTYNSAYWESSSKKLSYLQNIPSDGRMYSSNAFLSYFMDRTAPMGKYQHLFTDLHLLTSDIMQGSDGDSPYILWLRGEKNFYDFDDFDIRCLPGIEPVAERNGVVLFRVTGAEPFDAARHRACKQRHVQQLIEQAGEQVIRADSTWPVSTWGVEQADERVARAGWDLYRNGRKLTFYKKPCAPHDMQTNFVLQVRPDDPADLGADRRPSGFDNLDFNFYFYGGVRFDDQCVATAQLPDYPIGSIYIGRWISGNSRTLWKVKAKSM